MMLTNSVRKERILSEEYRDFIIGNKIPPSIAKVDPSQLCAQKLPYDYQHEAFRDIGGQTRIEAIWDQTIQSGTPPEGFIGGAPEATIAMVKLKESKQYLKEFYQIKSDAICFQENDIMMGIQYLKKLADTKNMPLVLCIALGTNLGSHTGISPLANILNRYADVGSMGIVTGVGNEANERQHFRGEATEEIEIRVEQGAEGFVVELWTEIPNLVNVSVVSPSGKILPPSPLRKGDNGEYVFTFEKTRVYMDYRLLMERSNSELVYLRFEKPVEDF